MAYTEVSPIVGYLQSTIQTKPGILNYITKPFGDRIGPTFTFLLPVRPTVSRVNYDPLPTDKNNTVTALTAVDDGARIPFTQSEYNAWQRMPGAKQGFLDKLAEALLINAEVALDVVLNASTNTVRLTTDNTMTRSLFFQGVSKISGYIDGNEPLIFVTNSDLVIGSLFDAGAIATDGGAITRWEGLGKVLGTLPGGVPVVKNVQMTNSTSTGGTAAYLWAPSGVLGGIDAVNAADPVWSPISGSYDLTGTIAYGFGLTGGVAEPRVVRFDNP